MTVSGSGTPLTQRLVEAVARRLAARDVGDRAMDAYDSECEWAEQQHYLAMAAAGLTVGLRELDQEVADRVLSDGEPVDLAALADSIEKGE